MQAITLHIILYDKLMRVVASQTFRAVRIKKGRVRGRHAICRRARRKNHSIASTARVERRPIGKCDRYDFFLISPIERSVFKTRYKVAVN